MRRQDEILLLISFSFRNVSDTHVRIFGEVMKHLNAEQQRWFMRIILKGQYMHHQSSAVCPNSS
jgi:hypothetical protein